MKVFVLMCESVYEMGNQVLSCAVFDTLEKAREELKKEYYIALPEHDAVDVFETNFDDEEFDDCKYIGRYGGKNDASIYLNGRYSETHIVWEIQEREIQ